jgi:hypothetical protein
MTIAAVKLDDEPLLPLDPHCPHCKDLHDIGEIYSGGAERCDSCDALLQAADDGEVMWLFVEKYPAVPPRTGRQRTRSRWSKQGRRG